VPLSASECASHQVLSTLNVTERIEKTLLLLKKELELLDAKADAALIDESIAQLN